MSQVCVFGSQHICWPAAPSCQSQPGVGPNPSHQSQPLAFLPAPIPQLLAVSVIRCSGSLQLLKFHSYFVQPSCPIVVSRKGAPSVLSENLSEQTAPVGSSGHTNSTGLSPC